MYKKSTSLPPFQSSSILDTVTRSSDDEPPDPDNKPSGYQAIVYRGYARFCAERYASCIDLSKQYCRFCNETL